MKKILMLIFILQCSSAYGFELYRADYASHIAQKIYVQVGAVPSAYDLKVTLTSTLGKNDVIHEKQNHLGAEEIFILNQRTLPAATYTLSVDLLDENNDVDKQVVESFVKSYNGLPKWGIDEFNNICNNGVPYFPITPFFIGKTKAALIPWLDYVNTLKGVGFAERRYSVDGWIDFLDLADQYRLPAIGPLRGYYWPHKTATGKYAIDGKYYQDQVVDIDKVTDWINAGKDHNALMMWSWKDEPHLGGVKNAKPPKEVLRWKEKCHELDPHHPVFVNYSGYFYTAGAAPNWRQNHIKKYSYLTYQPTFDDPIPGGTEKKLVADILGMDYYPFEYADKWETWTASVEDMCLAMDRMSDWNHNLVPKIAYVETCDIRTNNTPTPTPEEVKMLIWANIIHGAKGISWFHYFNPTPADNYAVMKDFVNEMEDLAPAVLGSDFEGNVSVSGKQGGRVDVMAKEYDNKVYIFAVNLKKAADHVTIISGKMPPNTSVNVYGESRSVQVSNGSFSDSFDAYGVHIYSYQTGGGGGSPSLTQVKNVAVEPVPD